MKEQYKVVATHFGLEKFIAHTANPLNVGAFGSDGIFLPEKIFNLSDRKLPYKEDPLVIDILKDQYNYTTGGSQGLQPIMISKLNINVAEYKKIGFVVVSGWDSVVTLHEFVSNRLKIDFSAGKKWHTSGLLSFDDVQEHMLDENGWKQLYIRVNIIYDVGSVNEFMDIANRYDDSNQLTKLNALSKIFLQK